jgi:predicted transcriptional regulator
MEDGMQLNLDFNARSVENRDQVYHSLPEPVLSGMRAKIMDYLRANGPATREEVATALGKEVHQISGRFTALLKADLIEETDQKRPTRTGHQAVVVRVKS